MYDIERLEEQWRRYRRKRVARVLLALFAVIVVLAVPLGYFFWKGEASQKEGATNPPEAAVSHSKAKGKTSPQSLQPPLAVNTPEKRKSSASSKQSRTAVSTPKQTDMVISVSDRSGNVVEKSQGHTAQKSSMQLQISDAKNSRVVKEIERRFPDTRDYDDAIYLARYYYAKQKYSKAEHWAMQANTIDSSQEESWLLYAKSKAKQGHRASALRILQAYYDQTGSLRAKLLIDRIRKGKKF
jgi:tetratricopeptide (TPR) repeat protein